MSSNDPLAQGLRVSWTNDQQRLSLGSCMTSSPNTHFKKDLGSNLIWYEVRSPLVFRGAAWHLCSMESITSIDSHCTWLFGLVNHWQALRSKIHMVLSESMTSIDPLAQGLWAWWTYDQQSPSLGSCMTSSPNSHLKKPCVKSYLVGGTDKHQSHAIPTPKSGHQIFVCHSCLMSGIIDKHRFKLHLVFWPGESMTIKDLVLPVHPQVIPTLRGIVHRLAHQGPNIFCTCCTRVSIKMTLCQILPGGRYG